MRRLGAEIVRIVLMGMLICLGAGYASAGDRYVTPVGSDTDNACTNAESPCATLGQAVLSAERGDVIKVACGTYTENVAIPSTLSNLTLQGGWKRDFSARRSNAALTTLDGDEGPVALMLETAVVNITLNVDGFTLRNAGSGLAVTNLGATVEVNIHNCRIRDNSGSGGVEFLNGGTAQIEVSGCEVEGNVGPLGGVSLLNGGIATLVLTQSRISGNICSSDGGPVRPPKIELDASLEIASPGLAGGAGVNVITTNGGDTNATLTRNRVEGNGGLYGGGVLFLSQGSQTRAELANNLIADNNTVLSGGGVAIWPMIRGTIGDDTEITLINNTIAGNTASTAASRGGGLFVSSLDPANSAWVFIDNCILWGNVAPSDGKDLEAVGEAVGVVARTSIIGPTLVDGAAYTPVDVMEEDPLFVAPGTGDYHLRAGSPAIEAGTYGVWMRVGGEWHYFKVALEDDFEGDRRPDLARTDCCDVQLGSDIGADEFVNLPVPSDAFQSTYTAQAVPVRASNPKYCFPMGVGPVASGGDDFNWRVWLPPFTGPVDLYLAIYIPAVSTDIFLFTEDGGLQRASEGVVPWRVADAGEVDVSLLGQIPSELLPAGSYYFLLLATPPGTFERYYMWVISVEMG